MAETRLTEKQRLEGAPAVEDLLYIVDVSDTTSHPEGTSKYINVQDFFSAEDSKVVKLSGSYNEIQRDNLFVPPGEIWIIYNDDAETLEYSGDDNVWKNFGEGLTEGNNTISFLTLEQSISNAISIHTAASGSYGEKYVEIKGGGQPNGTGIRFRPNRVDLLGMTIQMIANADGSQVITKEYGDAVYGGGQLAITMEVDGYDVHLKNGLGEVISTVTVAPDVIDIDATDSNGDNIDKTGKWVVGSRAGINGGATFQGKSNNPDPTDDSHIDEFLISR